MSIGETRQCQNCKQEFAIEPTDFKFYEKMQVPAPTFCPDCRLQRRMAWRNERTLYNRSCDATMSSNDLPDDIRDGDDSILKEIIECANGRQNTCAGVGVFRIIKNEFTFYKEQGIPLPRFCPNCRQLSRIKQRTPLTLWHRTCACQGPSSESEAYQNTIEHFHKDKHCPNEFETSYAPERKEIVYCEQCYQAEVA